MPRRRDGCRRWMVSARSHACGSARFCIQPCVSYSRIAPASFSTEIGQPRAVWTAGLWLLVVSMTIIPLGTSPRRSESRHGLGFEIGEELSLDPTILLLNRCRCEALRTPPY